MTPIVSLANVSRVLCIGAHSDDIEIGAAGTLLRIAQDRPDVHVIYALLSGNEQRHAEARQAAAMLMPDAARLTVSLDNFRDGFFPTLLSPIKERFEQLKSFSPDLVLTHTRMDRHQDHRVINELTWNTFRSHAIWEYEIPKWDGEAIEPNLFVPLSADVMQRKAEILTQCFGTQRSKHWFDEELFRGRARLRGMESNCHYAEAFVARKVVVN